MEVTIRDGRANVLDGRGSARIDEDATLEAFAGEVEALVRATLPRVTGVAYEWENSNADLAIMLDGPDDDDVRATVEDAVAAVYERGTFWVPARAGAATPRPPGPGARWLHFTETPEGFAGGLRPQSSTRSDDFKAEGLFVYRYDRRSLARLAGIWQGRTAIVVACPRRFVRLVQPNPLDDGRDADEYMIPVEHFDRAAVERTTEVSARGN